MAIVKNEVDFGDLVLSSPELRLDVQTEKSLISTKSLQTYQKAYNMFMQWQEKQDWKDSYTEKDFLSYFNEKSAIWKPSTLLSQYSMLRITMYEHHNVDINSFTKVIAFIKNLSKDFPTKKASTFTAQEINKFLTEAPDHQYLLAKVIMIFGIAGSCRCKELAKVTVHDVESHGNIYLVRIKKSKDGRPRSFTITEEFAKIVRKYAELRPSDIPTERFFFNCVQGKSTYQIIGINTLAKTPQKVAEYLKIENPKLYTGHSLRRTAVKLVTDIGANITTFNEHERISCSDSEDSEDSED